MICDARKPPKDIAGYDPSRDAGDSWYDEEAALHAVEFFDECLTYVTGPKAGEPFDLEPWQADVTKTLFGWKLPDGRRRFRDALIMVARKNGKTTWMAGLALYVLICDKEAGAQCYCGAGSADQAKLLFNAAQSMVADSGSGLDDITKTNITSKTISYKNSFLRAIPTNEGNAHGFDGHLIIGDELHAWTKREFYNALHTSVGARPQPLRIYISTAGYDRNSLLYERYQYACQVRDGQIDDRRFLPVIYETSPSDDWTSEKTWRKANPNLGVSVFTDFLEEECKRAQKDAAYEQTFRRLFLNQWTQVETRWLNMEHWRACEWTAEPFADGETVFGGLDLSSTKDLTAFALIQRTEKGWKVRCHYWLPEETLAEAEKRDRVPYRKWQAKGLVTPIPGRTVQYDEVQKHILRECNRLNIGGIGYDPWNAHNTRLCLEDAGVTLHAMSQGYAAISAPAKELERAVADHALDHGNDPCLEWQAGNVNIKTDDNGNIRPVKPGHSDSAKRIDGIVATIMALGTAELIQPDGPSIYTQPGVGVI